MNSNMKKMFRFLSSGRWNDSALFFLRLFVGVMMFTHGLAKIQNFNELAGSFPDPIGWGSTTSFVLIMLAETIGSLCIVAGFLLKPAALVLAFGMFTASFLAFPGASLSAHELPFIYMGIYIFLFICGGGKYALDRLVFRVK